MKKYIYWLIAVTLLISLMAVSVMATPEQCPCSCGQNLTQIQWTPWNVNETGNPATGHYYLTEDYAQSAQYTVNSGSRVVLDLRGHNLTTENAFRLFLIYGDLSIIDTVGGGCLSAKTTGKAVGGVLQVYYKNSDCGILRLQNVTVMPHVENSGAKNGGLIYVGDDCTLELDGCTLFGGNSDSNGGCIYAGPNSQLSIKDTTIMGCRAAVNGGSIYSSGDVTVTDSKIWGGIAQNAGGNIYKTGGTLTLDGSDIAFGTSYGATSHYSGGNLCSLGNATVICQNNTVLRDGYGAYAGGNAYIASGKQTFTDTVITGGVARNIGANLACTSASAVTTITDCRIDGDVHFSDGSLTLRGSTKIGLGSYGLDLNDGTATLMIQAAGLTQGAEIFVEATGIFTNDQSSKDFFKPALHTSAITATASGQLSATYASSGEMGGYCPHCYDPENPKTVVWTAFTGNTELTSGHYYLSANTTGQYNLPQDTDFVLDLNGKTLRSSQRAFTTTGTNATLSILDGVGIGKVCGGGSSNAGGGVIYSLQEAFQLNVYGGQLVYEKTASNTVLSGSVVSVAQNNSQVNIYGGVLDGSAQNYTTGNYGGTLFMGNVGTNKSFTMTAGRLLGGDAQYGGNVYLGNYVNATITGGVLQNGTGVEDGGNLRVNGNSATNRSEISIENCMILDGNVTGAFSGGNAYFINTNVTLENCYFESGRAANTGGNLRTGAATKLIANDTLLVKGNSTKGGNLYTAATNGENIFENCQFLAGNADNGGNAYLNHGKNTFTGGKVAFGTASAAGGNIYAHAGNYNAENQFTKLTGGVLLCGGNTGGNGGNLNVIGIVELDNVHIASGSAAAGHDIYLNKGATKTLLTLTDRVTGSISMAVNNALLSKNVYGDTIACTAATGINATIALEGDYGLPGILPKDGVLCVANVSVIDSHGQETWHTDSGTAMNACGSNDYIKLYAPVTLDLTKDCAVDLNGQTVSITGSGKLLGMDSSSDNFTNASGSAQWTQADRVNTAPRFIAPNGNTYYAICENDTVTYHRLHMALTDITLRPSDVGLYYTGVWECDSHLAAQIESCGIGVSLADMPKANMHTDTDTIVVNFPSEKLINSVCNSIIVKNIFKNNINAATNQDRGEMPIYAEPFVVFRDGTVYTTDETNGADYSLYSFLEAADRNITADPVTHRKTEKQLWDFYVTWQEKGAGNWKFDKIKKPVDPQDDDVMKILMIGQSHAQDTIWMLYDVLKAEMPDQDFLVVDVYRSVPLDDHVANIKNQAAVYDYYQNTNGAMEHTPNTTITEALVRENWDVIMFNEATWPQTREESYKNGNFEFMINHIREYTQTGFRLAYNATWAQPVSAELYKPERRQPPADFRNNFTAYFEGNRLSHFAKICQNMETFIETNEEFDLVFYSGTAIQYASETHGVPEGDPARIYDLYRDYTHLSDFGRLLVGYQLYAQIYGLEELTQVNVDLIPQHMRATDREKAFGDIQITSAHKEAIIASVNYALKNPHKAPPQTARPTPILEPLS